MGMHACIIYELTMMINFCLSISTIALQEDHLITIQTIERWCTMFACLFMFVFENWNVYSQQTCDCIILAFISFLYSRSFINHVHFSLYYIVKNYKHHCWMQVIIGLIKMNQLIYLFIVCIHLNYYTN